jgi:uncharacterized membrane protein
MRIDGVGHAVFAATWVALGLAGLIQRDFAAVWQPVPRGLPGREALILLCAVVSLVAGLGVLSRRAAPAASGLLFAYWLIWMLSFRLPVLVHRGAAVVSWEECGETAVIVAAAWALYARFAVDRGRPLFGFAIGERGLRGARALFGLAIIAFGVAHFAYLAQTAALVPHWLPAHALWAHVTGVAYVAAGIAVLAGAFARLAAAMATVQMGLFTLLVWAPLVITSGAADARSEAVISWTLTAGAWVVADSYGRRAFPLRRTQRNGRLS